MNTKKQQNTPKVPNDKNDNKPKAKKSNEATFSAFVKPTGPQTAQNEEDQTHLAYDEAVKHVSNLELPPDWQRVGDPGKIIYYNEKDNITTKRHPSISKFRSLFMEILEYILQKSLSYNRNEDLGRSKLLELKLKAKQYLESEKKNKESLSKKGKKSTIVLLGSTLSKNLLKGPGSEKNAKLGTSEPQKIVETGKSMDRFEEIKRVLQERRSMFEKVNYEIDNLENSEKVLTSCVQYYEQKFGANIEEPTTLIKKSEEYEQVDPMEMVEAAKLFNVKSTEPYLFWLLRLYCALPLPDYWNKIFDPSVQMEIYHSLQDNIRISVKPCYSYIQLLINNLKETTRNNPEARQSSSTKIKLSDKLGRPYEIDFGTLLKEVTETDKKDRKYQVYHSMMNQDDKDGESSKNKAKKAEQNTNFKDAHFLEIANQIGLDMKKDIHLMMYIEEFVKERERDEKWFYRQASDGSAFWVNHERKKAVQKYPYIEEVKKFVEEKKQLIELESMRFKKTDHKLLKTLFRKKSENDAIRLLIDEAKNFVEYYMTHKDQEFNLSAENQFYSLGNLSKHLGAQLTKNDLMDVLFYCPFDFTNLLEGLNISTSEQQLLKKLQVKPKATDGKQENLEEAPAEEEIDNTKPKSLKEEDDFIHQIKSEEAKQLLEMASNLSDIAVDANKKREFLKVMIDFGKKYENDDDESTPGTNLASGGVKRQNKNGSIDVDSNKRNLKSTTTNQANADKDAGKNVESKGNKKSRKKNLISGDSEEEDAFDEDGSPAGLKKLKERRSGAPLRDDKRGDKSESSEPTRDSVKRKMEKSGDNSKLLESPLNDKVKDRELKRMYTESGKIYDQNATGKKDNLEAIAKYGEKEFRLETVRDDNSAIDGYTESAASEDSDLDKDDDDKDDDHDKEDDDDDEDGEESEYDSEEVDGEKKKRKKKKKGDKLSKDKSLDKKASPQMTTAKKTGKDPKFLSRDLRAASQINVKDLAKDLKTKPGRGSGEQMKPIVAEKSAHDVFAKLVSNQNTRPNRNSFHKREKDRESSISRESPHFQLMTDDEEELNFDDLHVIHQEITREDGETEIITVATKKTPFGKIPQRKSRIKKKVAKLNQTLDDDSVEIMMDENGMPIAVRSKNRQKTGIRVPNSGLQASTLDGRKWDYDELKKTLDKTNIAEIDKTIAKERRKLRRDMKKSVNSFERILKRKDPTYKSSKLSRNLNYRRSVEPQEDLGSVESRRRNSAPSGLNTTFDDSDVDEKPLKREELAKLLRTAYRADKKKKKSQRLMAEKSADSRPTNAFYTPFKTNSTSKNTMRYISYLNSLLFLKKVDDVVVDFLIGQFIKSHQAATGLEFDPNDKNFKEQFKKSYAKAIRTLKERLKKNKEFIQNTFSQMFFYSIDNIDFDASMKKALEPIILKSIPISEENLFSPPVKPDVIVPVSPSQIADKGLARTQPDFNKTKVKLPPIKSKKQPTQQTKYSSYYKSMKALPKHNEFNDSRMRTLDDDDTFRDEESEIERTAREQKQFTAEIDIGRLMKIIPDHIKDNYLFYWSTYGDPMSLDLSFFLNKVAVPDKIQPYLIVLMANRLGLKVSNYADLTWIPYFHLISKLPSNSDLNSNSLPKDKLWLKIAYLPTGEHPGDNYFYSLINYHKAKREIILDNMSPDQRNNFIKAQSWIKMKNDSGITYYFNFFSKQKSDDMPTELKESFTKISLIYSKPFVKDNLKALGYMILRNDDLLAYFKHKH